VQIVENQGYEVQEKYVSDDHIDYDIQVVNMFARKEK
jgi:hypothetical protein